MKNAVTGLGLPPEAALVTFPMDMFLPGSDLAPLRERKHEIYDGLTRWKPRYKQTAGANAMLRVEGADYEDALDKANDLLLTNLWGDGLPVRVPTRSRVDWILRGSPLPRTHVLGKLPSRGALVTVETCAIALAMAGGRPEYLPVLLAAVDAFLDPRSETEHLQPTSGGPIPVVIVNGPIARQIRLNSGFGCLGPDPRRPAGASIGRALRLLQQNVGGALPGNGTMATYGAMRYTNMIFAEDEEGLPEGWDSHAAERHGFSRGTNSISLLFVNGVANIKRCGARKETPEEDALQGMYRMADFMRTPNMSCLSGYENGAPGIMIITRVVARSMASLGWTKSSMREFLWEHSKIPRHLLSRAGGPAWIELESNPVTLASLNLDPWPITAAPENVVLVVAGGEHPTHSYWLQGYCPGVMGRQVAVPECFDELLASADRDLGCGADVCMI